MLSIGLDEEVLDGLSARFVLDPGYDGEGIEQTSSLHVGDPFAAPARGPWLERDHLSGYLEGL